MQTSLRSLCTSFSRLSHRCTISMPRVKEKTVVTNLVLPTPAADAAPSTHRRSSRITKAAAASIAEAGASTSIAKPSSDEPQKKKQSRAKTKPPSKSAAPQAVDAASITAETVQPPKKQRKRKAPAMAETDYEANDQMAIVAERRAKGFKVGAHLSTSGGLENAVVNAVAVGATAFALDLRSKRKWESQPMSEDTVKAFKAALQAFGYSPSVIVPHGSYLINLGSPNIETLEKSRKAIVDEINRAQQLGIPWYNIHPGSSCGEMSDEACMDQIAAELTTALQQTQDVTILLESTAGQGNCVGHRFEHLRYIIDRVGDQHRHRVAVCLDTCHMYAAGYDIASSQSAFDDVLKEFDEKVGLQLLKAMHVNDSKVELGKRKDRHENIGKGTMGVDCFRWLMSDAGLRDVVMIMETPCQVEGPKVNFGMSLEKGVLVLRELEADVGENTDKRDISLLCSLRE